jgi:hypothetical protein
MTQVIIYNQDNGVVAVVVPTPEALASHTIMEIAIKDVPAGKPFAIVNAEDLPQDVPQEAWTVSVLELTDGIGGESNEFQD